LNEMPPPPSVDSKNSKSPQRPCRRRAIEISRSAISQCLGETPGEVAGVDVGLTHTLPAGLGMGNANVDAGEADGVMDEVGEREEVGVAVEEGAGLRVGVGGGGMIFSQ